MEYVKIHPFKLVIKIIETLIILWFTSGISLWTILTICITINIGYGSSKIEYFKISKNKDNISFEYIRNIIYKCIFFAFYYSFLRSIIISYWKTYLRIIITISKKKKNSNIEIFILLLIFLILIIVMFINLNGFFFTFQWIILLYTGSGFFIIFLINFFSKYNRLKNHFKFYKNEEKFDLYKYNKYTYCSVNGMKSGKSSKNYFFNCMNYFSIYIMLALVFNHKFYLGFICLIVILIFNVIIQIRYYWIDLYIVFFSIYSFFYESFFSICNFFCKTFCSIFCKSAPDISYEEINNNQIELKENIINFGNISPDIISIEESKLIEIKKNIIKENKEKNKCLLDILNIFFNKNKKKIRKKKSKKKNKRKNHKKKKKCKRNKRNNNIKNFFNIPTTKNPIKIKDNVFIKRINAKEIKITIYDEEHILNNLNFIKLKLHLKRNILSSWDYNYLSESYTVIFICRCLKYFVGFTILYRNNWNIYNNNNKDDNLNANLIVFFPYFYFLLIFSQDFVYIFGKNKYFSIPSRTTEWFLKYCKVIELITSILACLKISEGYIRLIFFIIFWANIDCYSDCHYKWYYDIRKNKYIEKINNEFYNEVVENFSNSENDNEKEEEILIYIKKIIRYIESYDVHCKIYILLMGIIVLILLLVTLALRSPKINSSSNENLKPPAFCNLVYDNININDFAAFAYASYGNGRNDIIEKWNNSRTIINKYSYDFNIKDEKISENDNGVQYTSFTNGNVTVVAVRGSTTDEDWIQDFYLWSAPVLLQLSGYLGTFSQLWPRSATAFVIDMIDIDFPINNQLPYYEEVKKYVAQLRNTNKVYLVGHSLGGGIANIVGASLNIPSITFSSPGLGYSYKAHGITLEDIINNVTNIIPLMDPVPLFDSQVGNIQYIECKIERLFSCHKIEHTIEKLSNMCNRTIENISYVKNTDKK